MTGAGNRDPNRVSSTTQPYSLPSLPPKLRMRHIRPIRHPSLAVDRVADELADDVFEDPFTRLTARRGPRRNREIAEKVTNSRAIHLKSLMDGCSGDVQEGFCGTLS